MSADPLLQPFQLKHLTIRNRLMSTAHEPAYTHDGMPKDRYRAYHVEKAKGGIGLTMIGGSAVVAPDSPQAFGNILLYKDEVVGWLKALADESAIDRELVAHAAGNDLAALSVATAQSVSGEVEALVHPALLTTQATVDRTDEFLAALPEDSSALRRMMLENRDSVARALRARQADVG